MEIEIDYVEWVYFKKGYYPKVDEYLPAFPLKEIIDFERYYTDKEFFENSNFYEYLKNKRRAELIDKMLN